MNSFRVSKAIKQPQRLVRLASTGSLKDKTIGVIGMGHVGKYFLVLIVYNQYRFVRNGLIRNASEILSNFKKKRDEIAVLF